MNNDQIMSGVRSTVIAIGTIATMLGWASAGTVSTLQADILAAAGPLSILAMFLYGLYASSHRAKIAAVNAIPGKMVISTEGTK